MTIVNESVRFSKTPKAISMYGVTLTLMNPIAPNKNQCTWACSFNTRFCIKNHVKLDEKYLKFTDPIYFGIIKLLFSTGNYVLANLIFLVLGIPLFIFIFAKKIINIKKQIKNVISSVY